MSCPTRHGGSLPFRCSSVRELCQQGQEDRGMRAAGGTPATTQRVCQAVCERILCAECYQAGISMTRLDLVYLTLIVVGLALDHLVLWRAFVRRSQADAGAARLWLWSVWMIAFWALTGAGMALWLHEQRSWRALGFAALHGWWLAGAIILALLLAAVYARTIARIAGLPQARRIKLQSQFGQVASVVPHSRHELCWFIALSLSAGFCEEFVFRGYLIWVFQQMVGLWGAAAISIAAFAAGHAYQGRRGVISAGIGGALFTLLMLIFKSLWLVMALHAMVDICQGFVAWLVFREAQSRAGVVEA
jgi:uncharacterized protein